MQFARNHGIDPTSTPLAQEPVILEEVARGVARANERLARVEQIKRFKVLPSEWEPGGDELTPTQKLRRRPIAEKYRAEIDALYADAGAAREDRAG
jgi:long-subunit acyl-CoA synthetase (AMP-forming)